MNDTASIFLLGMIIGVVALAGAIELTPSSVVSLSKSAIAECEKTLPRNQHCEIIAVPKKEVEEKNEH